MPAQPSEELEAPPVDWEAELKRERAEHEVALAEIARDKEEAMDAVAQLKSALEAQLKGKSARDREQRAELMRRQIARRMVNTKLNAGWAAWKDLAMKRAHALKRLRSACAHLHAPDMARAFVWWHRYLGLRRQKRQERALQAQERAIEGKLRQAQFEAGQLAMLKVAHDDEIASRTSVLEELVSSYESDKEFQR